MNIGSGNGLVPSGTKPVPEPMLTQIYVAICKTRPQWINSQQNNVWWQLWFFTSFKRRLHVCKISSHWLTPNQETKSDLNCFNTPAHLKLQLSYEKTSQFLSTFPLITDTSISSNEKNTKNPNQDIKSIKKKKKSQMAIRNSVIYMDHVPLVTY